MHSNTSSESRWAIPGCLWPFLMWLLWIGVLEIMCPYKYKEGLEGSESGAYLPWWKLLSVTYPPILHTYLTKNICLSNEHLWFHGVNQVKVGRDSPFLQEILPKAEVFFMDRLLPEPSRSAVAKTPTWLKSNQRSNVCTAEGQVLTNYQVQRLLPTLWLYMCEHYQMLQKMEMWMQIDPNKSWKEVHLQFCRHWRWNSKFTSKKKLNSPQDRMFDVFIWYYWLFTFLCTFPFDYIMVPSLDCI